MSEQFVFGPEHVGRRVRHRDGRKGFIRTVIQYIGLTNHFEVLFDDGTIRVYTSLGKLLNSCEEIVISLDEQSEPDQTPDLLARVEALEAQLQKLTSRVYDLELVEKSMCESQAVTQSGDVSFDDLRFVLPENNTEAKAEKEAVFSGDEISRAFCKVHGEIFGEQSPKDTYQFPMIRHKLRFVEPEAITQPDPTAQKVEALRVLFPFPDGYNFMTADKQTGCVYQWVNEPVRVGSEWLAKIRSVMGLKCGQITPDPELSKILITHHVEQ